MPERASPRGGSAQGRVTVEGARALDDVRRRLSTAAGLAVEADPGLRLERPLTLRDAPWRDALRVVAAVAGARVETRAGRARLVAPPSTHLHVTRAALGDVIELLGAFIFLSFSSCFLSSSFFFFSRSRSPETR